MMFVAAMLHFSVAQHYCKGELVASRITLSGALATCSMETSNEDCRHDQNSHQLDSYCCDDVLISYSINNNYTPAAKTTPGIDRANKPVPAVPFASPVRFSFFNLQTCSDISPPGIEMASSVDLKEIRVFRI
jgi:hypothetical protein